MQIIDGHSELAACRIISSRVLAQVKDLVETVCTGKPPGLFSTLLYYFACLLSKSVPSTSQ